MYLAALEAMRARLEGKPREFIAPLGPLSQLTKVGDITTGDLASLAGFFQRTTNITLLGYRIPIILLGLYGVDVGKGVPSFTIDLVDMPARFTEWIPRTDRVYDKLDYSSRQAFDDKGDSLGSIPRMARSKEPGQGYDFMFEIVNYARDPVMSALMVRHVSEVLQPRDSLREAQLDGTYKVRYVMQRTFHVQNSKQGAGIMTNNDNLMYSNRWIYQVRSFMDTTDTWVLKNLIRYRTITMEQNG